MTGEKHGDREVMDRVTKNLVESNVKPSEAAELARQSMVRTDRRLREQGKR